MDILNSAVGGEGDALDDLDQLLNEIGSGSDSDALDHESKHDETHHLVYTLSYLYIQTAYSLFVLYLMSVVCILYF